MSEKHNWDRAIEQHAIWIQLDAEALENNELFQACVDFVQKQRQQEKFETSQCTGACSSGHCKMTYVH